MAESLAIFDTVDLKFISKHKRFVINHVETLAGEYLKLIRPSNDKKMSIDVHAKDQIMYIFYKIITIVSKIQGDIPDCDKMYLWVENNLDTKSSDYKIYKYVTGITRGVGYTMVGSPVEEKSLFIIAEYIDDEDMMQHVVELFLLFVKRFAEVLANISWDVTKKINSKTVNGLLRNMDRNNINPDIFLEIYAFADFNKSNNVKTT
jgi:hypothetical protein